MGNGHLEKGMAPLANPFAKDALATKFQEILRTRRGFLERRRTHEATTILMIRWMGIVTFTKCGCRTSAPPCQSKTSVHNFSARSSVFTASALLR